MDQASNPLQIAPHPEPVIACRFSGVVPPTYSVILSLGIVTCIVLAMWGGQRVMVRAVLDGVRAGLGGAPAHAAASIDIASRWEGARAEHELTSHATITNEDGVHALADQHFRTLAAFQEKDPRRNQ